MKFNFLNSRYILWVGVGIVGVSFAACASAGSQSASLSPACELPSVSSGSSGQSLELVGCMLESEIRPGDPIPVFLGLSNASNGPLLVRARLDLGAYVLVRVEDEAGTQREITVREPGHFDEEMTDVLLPRGGLIGRTLDLVCDQGGYRSSNVRCFSEFRVTEPGTYRVTFSYVMRCGMDRCPNDYPWTGKLTTSPLKFTILPG